MASPPARPESIPDSPGPLPSANRRCWDGSRRSASISSVRSPNCEKTMARLAAMKLRPSFLPGLTTARTLRAEFAECADRLAAGAASNQRNTSWLRNARSCSTIGVSGRYAATSVRSRRVSSPEMHGKSNCRASAKRMSSRLSRPSATAASPKRIPRSFWKRWMHSASSGVSRPASMRMPPMERSPGAASCATISDRGGSMSRRFMRVLRRSATGTGVCAAPSQRSRPGGRCRSGAECLPAGGCRRLLRDGYSGRH